MALERADRVSPHVEKPRAAWTAQILPPGGREHVAPDATDVEIELPDGLAGVEEIEDPVARGHRSDLGGRVDEPALGGHVGEGDQSGPRADRALQRVHVDLCGGVVVDDVDLDPHAPFICKKAR